MEEDKNIFQQGKEKTLETSKKIMENDKSVTFLRLRNRCKNFKLNQMTGQWPSSMAWLNWRI